MGKSNDETGTDMKKSIELPGFLIAVLFTKLMSFIVFWKFCIDGSCRADFSPQLSIIQSSPVTDSGLKTVLHNSIAQDKKTRGLVSQQPGHNLYTNRTVINSSISFRSTNSPSPKGEGRDEGKSYAGIFGTINKNFLLFWGLSFDCKY